MIARLALALPLLGLAAASGPVQPTAEPLELSARRALAEARIAEAQVQKLQTAAEKAQDEAERIGVQRAAAAQAIAAAEARISAADANARVISAQILMRRDRLRKEQAPVDGLARRARRDVRAAALARDPRPRFDRGIRPRAASRLTQPCRRSAPEPPRFAPQLARGRTLQKDAEDARAEL